MKNKWALLCACLGVALLALNLAGLFIDHRPAELNAPGGGFADQVTLDYGQTLRALEAARDLPGLEKAARVTRIIAQATAHSNGFHGAPVQTRTPWTENWVLRLLGEAEPALVPLGLPRGTFSYFQYQNPWRALERGVGLCCQLSVILSGVLSDMGMESGVLQLNGHVVVYARQDGQEWILDPDLDVVLPFGLDEACARKDEVMRLYREAGMPEQLALLVPRAYCQGEQEHIAPRIGAYRPRLYVFEQGLYVVKWLVPLLLLVPVLVSRRTG